MTFHILPYHSQGTTTGYGRLAKPTLDINDPTPLSTDSSSARRHTPIELSRIQMPGLIAEVADMKDATSKRCTPRKKLIPTPLSRPPQQGVTVVAGHCHVQAESSSAGTDIASTVLKQPAVKSRKRRQGATRSVISGHHDSQPRPKSKLQSRLPHNRALFIIRRKLSVESVPLSRIPSFMDHFLNHQSPSVDYDSEEIMLEIAYRINLNRIRQSSYYATRHYPRTLGLRRRGWDDAGYGDGSDYDMNIVTDSEAEDASSVITRHPDSFERSTSTWTDSDVSV
ncbi:hypothetical protein VNI00_001146 [Paramarasmius palmivorus]|uniref:Uncharacterized protein n=1 Tax=Paramarasmius palmivorus TaxID=297713 RepID=A0AAW0E9U3_9AGAR